MSAVLSLLQRAPVVPVVVLEDVDHAVPLARALVEGGLPVVEVTLRTPAALPALRRIADEVPEAVVGAGTVVLPQDVEAAVEAGAQFLVSPGATPTLLDAMAAVDVPSLPGAATASEVVALVERGVTVAKFFPAKAAGGTAMLASLAGPFPQVRFCPTGGIDLASAPDYLALANVVCVGGSWLTPRDAVSAGDWGRIATLARQAATLRH
ncbi:MAG: bifunctional 4-hydroxy-2-oxoglutarate aldolase/2-dehydro-3-deoxy-phosphogluconate aldolase [Actinomycetes bacterium]